MSPVLYRTCDLRAPGTVITGHSALALVVDDFKPPLSPFQRSDFKAILSNCRSEVDADADMVIRSGFRDEDHDLMFKLTFRRIIMGSFGTKSKHCLALERMRPTSWFVKEGLDEWYHFRVSMMK